MAILNEWTIEFMSNSLAQTERFGIRMGELLQNYDVLGLVGPLGSGKTAFGRGVGRGWGSAQRVTSPTFTLVNEYPRLTDGLILYHVDCYRLSGRDDIISAGIPDILDRPGAIMIEWPQQAAAWLPADHLQIEFRYLNETRRGLQMVAFGPRAAERMAAFRKNAFGV